MYTNYELWFTFACIWSLGATVNEDGRKKMDALFRDIKPIFSHEGTVYDYYINRDRSEPVLFSSML